MTQEDKELLLKDFSSRLSYGLKCKICLDEYCGWNPEYDKILSDAAKVKPELPSEIREKIYTLYGIEGTRAILLEFEDHGYGVPIEFIKPYLRPISSMTDEEREEYRKFSYYGAAGIRPYTCDDFVAVPSFEKMDWLHAYHFDYRGLIEKGIALEATEGMYNLEKK